MLVAILAASCALAFGQPAEGPLQAVVHDAEGQLHTLDLGHDGAITVQTELGTNTVVVKDGAARIVEADCPNGDCLRQQAISQPGEQLICLPHRLWVEVVPAGEAGGSLNAAAVKTDDADPSIDTVAR